MDFISKALEPSQITAEAGVSRPKQVCSDVSGIQCRCTTKRHGPQRLRQRHLIHLPKRNYLQRSVRGREATQRQSQHLLIALMQKAAIIEQFFPEEAQWVVVRPQD